MKCIIFGLSTCRNSIEQYLNKDVEIIGYADSFSKLNTFNNKKFYTSYELRNIDFDIIIIAINNSKSSFVVKNNLINIGIDKEKIVTAQDYFKYINYLKGSKRYVANMNVKDKIEGIILGISYGQAGIIPNVLGKNFYNLAFGSQDLFYNLQQVKLLKRYKSKLINDLKYVIIDMYNYTYFNYDVSLSNNASSFIFVNGFDEIHNLKSNKEYNEIENNFYSSDFTDQEISKLSKVFNDSLIVKNNENYYFNKEEREKELSQSEIDFVKDKSTISSIESKVFSKTEKENKKIFNELINEIYEINPSIKIYAVLLPTYYGFHNNSKINWKNRFMNIINEFTCDNRVKFFDYTNKFLNKKEYFFDLEHLNYKGSTSFTNILKNDMNL